MRTIIFFVFWVIGQMPLLAQTTVYSQFSGTWTTTNIWNSAADGSGTNYSTVDDPTISVVIQSGHAITLPNSGYSVNNLTVESDASLKANIGINRYIQIYGTSAVFDGTIGGSGDGFSLDINGPTCEISGSGTINMSRLQKDCGDPGVAPATDLTISCDLNLGWSSSASILCTGNPSNSIQRTFDVTVAAGVTVAVAGDISIDGTNGTNNTWQDGTFTVNGTLDIADDLYVTSSSNPSGGDISYIIGNGGRILVRSQVIGNNGATGASNANLTIQNGGTLELNGAGAVFSSLSATKNTFTLEPISTVEYSGASAKTVEDFFTYANVIVSGGGQKNLEGNTTMNGILTLTDGIVQLSAFNLTISPSGSTSGGSEASYVRTNSTGVLKQTGSGSPVSYPLGNSSYNPAVLTNSGSSDVFSVRVLDDVFTNGTSGPVITGNVVDRTWLVDEAAAGGSNLTLEVEWSEGQELSGFDRDNCYVSHYLGSAWSGDNTAAASGGDPYSRSRSGITNLSPFAVGANNALPIELSHFEAKLQYNQVHLSWSTASETDNSHFNIERSPNGHEFTEIGRIAGAGTVREKREYTFVDENPLPGANYYRLRQVDLGGRFSFSPVRRVVIGTAASPLSLFPSPAGEYVQVQWAKTSDTDSNWEIFDTAGRRVSSGVFPAESTEAPVFVGDLQQGAYFLRIVSGQQTWTQAFVKQ